MNKLGKMGLSVSSVHEKVLETVTAFAVDHGFSVKGWTFHLFKVVMVTLSFSHYLEKTNSPQNDAQTSIKEVVAQAHKEFKRMKKNDRLELIRKIVQENKITTQGELVKLLQNEGLKATQADCIA